jgi:hypothetical protein
MKLSFFNNNNKQKLSFCVFSNFCLLIFITTPIIILNDGNSKYFRIGWNDELILISIPINSFQRYIFTLLFIAAIKISNVFIMEVAHPILNFNIYNPDKKLIKDFTKSELQFLGNAMYFIDGFKNILTIMISITQIDIALFGMIISQTTSIYTIHQILKTKKFLTNIIVDESQELLG